MGSDDASQSQQLNQQSQNNGVRFQFQVSEEKKIEILYSNSAKTEQNNLKFSELLMLLLEKGLVRNGFGLKFYLENYQKAVDEDVKEEKKAPEITTDLRQMKKIQEAAKESAPGKMSKYRFENFLKNVGKQYFHGQKNPIEKFLEQIMIEQPVGRKKSAQANLPFHRTFNPDESNKKLLHEQVIEAILDYDEDLKRLFTAYISENYDKQQIMLSWEELGMLNKKMSSMSMVKLLLDANILPTQLTPEGYSDIQMRVVPPFNTPEQHFYSGETIKKIAEKDIGKKLITSRYEGDPCLSYFEFCMVLGKLAIDHTSKDQIKKDRDLYDAVSRYFSNILGIRPKTQQNDWEFFKKANKYMTQYLYKLYCPIQSQTQSQQKKEKDDDKQNTQTSSGQQQLSSGINISTGLKKGKTEDPEEKYFDQPLKLLQAIENNARFGEGIAMKYELEAIHKTLITELPPIPPAYQPKKELVDITKFTPKVIGEQPPKPPVDKTKKPEKADAKKKPKKAGEEEEREIRWEGMPTPPPATTYDHFQKYNDQLEFNNPYQIHQQSGVMSHIEAAPVILEEMIYPQNIPAESKRLLEASLLNFAQQNFAASLENLNACYESWLNAEDRSDLTIQNEIFFEYFKGSLFQAAGRDDLSLSSFFSSKQYSDKLGMDSPDKALPFCGLGGILFRMEEYQLALRSYLKAREIREISIGGDNIETATVYNNLGCCMLKLNRNLEASSYFEIAEAIFDLELGQFHIRTATASRNLTKTKKQGISFLPEFRVPWVAYEKDPLKKAKPKKDDKKGKK